MRWKKNGYITQATYRSLPFSEGSLPRAYGLPKIHKPNCPLRIIVSSINIPLYNIASYLHKIMIKCFPVSHSFIKNSFELVDKIKNVNLDNGYKLISLDVVSLFANIPIELAIESISNRWNFISEEIELPMSKFLMGSNIVLNSTFFMFNNNFYRQIYGTPMGSPLSPIIADIVIQDIENKALSILNFSTPFYYRYVDDIITAIPFDQIDYILNVFNSLHPRLKFTLEVENDNIINFLEIAISTFNNKLEFDWYHKPTFSGRYLHFLSLHPECQKKGTIFGLVDKAITLSHPKHHQKNIILIINILVKNGYPLKFIFDNINHRLFSFNK
ncbi:uncharacterized protein [Anoplolepis gracilipes]|uniref:uncharacterized protein n=1 Tax=Anoplolepis gracilipes TaxID=354296 RepID=UPI003BA16C3A